MIPRTDGALHVLVDWIKTVRYSVIMANKVGSCGVCLRDDVPLRLNGRLAIHDYHPDGGASVQCGNVDGYHRLSHPPVETLAAKSPMLEDGKGRCLMCSKIMDNHAHNCVTRRGFEPHHGESISDALGRMFDYALDKAADWESAVRDASDASDEVDKLNRECEKLRRQTDKLKAAITKMKSR